MKRFFRCMLPCTLILASIISCDKYYGGYYDDLYYETSTDFLTLRNYSPEATVWYIPDAESGGDLPLNLSEWQKISVYEVGPRSAVQLSFNSDDSYVTPVETYGVNDKMTIYVFKKDVWDKYEWAEIVSDRMWCGMCRLSVEEACRQDSIVTYPMM